MINYDEFGYDYQFCLVKNLHSTDVLIGESGGLSAIYNIEKSIVKDRFVLETEHGSLYLNTDATVAIMKRFEKEYEISVSNRFFAESHEDAVAQMASWLADNAYVAGYRVNEIDGESRFIDAELCETYSIDSL